MIMLLMNTHIEIENTTDRARNPRTKSNAWRESSRNMSWYDHKIHASWNNNIFMNWVLLKVALTLEPGINVFEYIARISSTLKAACFESEMYSTIRMIRFWWSWAIIIYHLNIIMKIVYSSLFIQLIFMKHWEFTQMNSE